MIVVPSTPRPLSCPPSPGRLAFPYIDSDMEQRLRALIEVQAEMLADADQIVRVELDCAGACPAQHQGVMLCAAQELTANAIRHGFYARMIGRIRVALVATEAETRLTIADDGWGLGPHPTEGAGLCRIRTLVAPFGGGLILHSACGAIAEAWLPRTREPRA